MSMKNRGALPGVSTGMSLWCQTKVEMSLFVPIWCCWWFCGSLAWKEPNPAQQPKGRNSKRRVCQPWLLHRLTKAPIWWRRFGFTSAWSKARIGSNRRQVAARSFALGTSTTNDAWITCAKGPETFWWRQLKEALGERPSRLLLGSPSKCGITGRLHGA